MQDLRRASARREFTLVSMFANLGGFEMGAMRAGGHPALANEISPIALGIHRRNFPDVVLDSRDVRAIAASPQATAGFLARAGLAPGQPDCIAGGSPCNRFSTLSRRYNLHRSPPDTRRLLLDLADVIRHAQPLTAVMENVAALAIRHPIYLANVLDRIRYSEAGHRRYFAAHKVLCASHYAVPQIRRRTIVFAVRADVGEAVGLTTDDGIEAIFPEPITPVPLTVRWALQAVRQTARHKDAFHKPMAQGSVAEVVRRLPLDPDDVTRPFNVGMSRQSWFNLERCAWDKPATPLTARGLMPISLGGPLHPSAHRKFSIPEILRLFGVPDDFDFGWSTASEAAERLGLMVPPPMAEALFRALLDRVLLPHRNA